MRANRATDVPIEYLLRTIRVVVWTTALVVLALAVSLVLPGGDARDAATLLPTLAVAVAVGVGMGSLPWDRLVRSRLGPVLLHVWSVAYIVLISVAVYLNGGGRSALFLLYALTIVFAAMVYGWVNQVVLFAFTVGCYLVALAGNGWNATPPRVFAIVAGLGALAFMAGHLSRELRAAMRARAQDASEAAGRARLLQVVAEAARSVSLLDVDRVLQAVVDAASRLGFEAANLALYDDAGLHYRVAHGVGLPPAYTEVRHSVDTGMPGLVREGGETVVVEDYAAHPKAIPLLREAGFRAVVATPVWAQGSIDAALIAGTRERRPITDEDVEAVELLAALAGRALENAQMFEDEHRAVERLAELDRLKSDFLSTVSHELRTPLTAMQGMGLTLEQQWDQLDDHVRRELIGRLNANAASLHRIISTLLDFSRFEAGAMDAHQEPVHLQPFVHGLVGRLGTMLAGHRLSVRIPEDLVVRADPALLERVLENLLSNAVKFTPEQTEVLIDADRDPEGWATIAVTDRGPGIRPEDLQYLGDRFFRGGDPRTRRARGTGLGLALVREILRLHGTELQIDAEEGRGARFAFRLRVVADPAAGPASSPAPSSGEPTSAP